MFDRKKIDLRMIDPSSKLTLKMSCLAACNHDVAKAKELYEYMIDGVGDMPDFPMPRPSAMQQFTQQAENLFGWVDKNADKIMKGYNMFQMIRGNAPAQVTGAVAEGAAEIPPLPPIE